MRILNWNIQQGGRCFEQSISLLGSKQADLIVLPEFRNNHAGDKFREGLRAIGFSYQTCSTVFGSNVNGVGVFAKEPFHVIPNMFQEIPNHVIVFGYQGYTVITSFCADKNVTKTFIQKVMDTELFPDVIIIGDLNMGPTGARKRDYRRLDLFGQVGFVDIWRLKHSRPCWSYQSGRGKSQPDHVLCKFRTNPADQPDRFKADFDLVPIFNKLSDHGVMMFEYAHNPL